MAPLVSVVIPTYNHARYVCEALESVFAQTCQDYEVIVINDGSPDNTAAVLRPWAESGKIRYLEQLNAGQGAARNRGLSEARGEFVAFLDDDDVWPADKLAWQIASLREHPNWVMVAGSDGHVESDGSRREPDAASGAVSLHTVDTIFEHNRLGSPGQVLIRRSTLDAVGGFDPAIWGCDDLDLWLRLAARGPVALVEKNALYYRRHATNASHAAERMFWNAMRAARKNSPLVSPARRASAWRGMLRCAYHYSGCRVVEAATSHFPRRGWPALRLLAFLALPMLRDLELAKMVGRDLLPAWMRRPGRAKER